MNIALLLTPKCDVTFEYVDCTLLHGMRKLRRSGFSAFPVITRDGLYAGSVSEGDFLWFLSGGEEPVFADLGKKTLQTVLNTQRNPPVAITAAMEDVLSRALRQNFIPVVDDRGVFIGIVTRKAIIGHFFAELSEQQHTLSGHN